MTYVLKRLRIPLLLAAVLTAPALLDAVFIAPHAVFIDHDTRAAQVTLGNGGDEPEEVTVDLTFGYPDTDSSGAPYIRFVENPGTEFPSSAEWIRAYPRRVRLEPGDRQTVRLLATPPADLPDGEYWSRLIVTSRGGAIPVETADTSVRAGLELELRLVVAVTYRKGAVQTGIALSDLVARPAGDSLLARMTLERHGNAAYLGTAQFSVLDSAGTAVREWAIPIAVYYTMDRVFPLPLNALPPGSYSLALRISTERTDLEEGTVLPAPAVADTVGFEMP